MKFSRVTAAIMMASLSTPLFAASEQSVGKLTSASQGTVVARDGKLIAGQPGQSLFVGDRVITRGTSKASVAMSGCSVSLAPTSILTVSATPCAQPKSFAQQDGTDAGAGGVAATAGTEGGVTATAIVIGVVAAAAVVGGVVAATSNSDTSPNSP